MEYDIIRPVILDASATIAALSNEKGAEKVKPLLPLSVMSSVNISEVAKYLIETNNKTKSQAEDIIDKTIQNIIPFTKSQAMLSAELIKVTKPFGISLADRACLALAMETGYPVYTADRLWEKLNLDLDIVFLR